MKKPRILLLVVVLAVAGVGFWLHRRETRAGRPDGVPPVVRIDSGGLRFKYHVRTGRESLFDLAKDPRCVHNLIRERPKDAARLRRMLAKRLGVRSLEDLRDPDEKAARTLRGLGYF